MSPIENSQNSFQGKFCGVLTWCRMRGSNSRQLAYKTSALPTELIRRYSLNVWQSSWESNPVKNFSFYGLANRCINHPAPTLKLISVTFYKNLVERIGLEPITWSLQSYRSPWWASAPKILSGYGYPEMVFLAHSTLNFDLHQKLTEWSFCSSKIIASFKTSRLELLQTFLSSLIYWFWWAINFIF